MYKYIQSRLTQKIGAKVTVQLVHKLGWSGASSMIRVETILQKPPFSGARPTPAAQSLELCVTHISVSILAASLMAVALCPANATTRKVRVPNQYDGSWTIVATTDQGPCSANTSYQVRIKNSDASIPGEEVDIDGGVSAGGAVQATIVKGSNKVPIAGSLKAKGSGSGTWRTSGGLVECSGSWSARRAG